MVRLDERISEWSGGKKRQGRGDSLGWERDLWEHQLEFADANAEIKKRRKGAPNKKVWLLGDSTRT